MVNRNKKQSSALFDTARKTVERYSMISSGDSILVGVSGGPDSVALLLFLLDIASSISIRNYPAAIPCLSVITTGASNIRIGVAHINHSLRAEESDRDDNFVRTLAEKYTIPCYSIKVDVPAFAKEKKLSFEEAARDIRYSFYDKIAQKEHYSKIALGHNSDDNAELVLMNLLRGSGAKGISGILPVRDNKFIRPLIEVSRYNILEYLKSKKQSYVLDSSNNDTSYLRNRIRHLLIPHLQEYYNPSVTESLNRLSRILIDENSWMEEETEKIFNKSNTNEVRLNIKVFFTIHQALAKRLIRRAIEEVKGDLRRVSFTHIDDILNLIHSKTGGSMIHLPDRVYVIKSKGDICFRKESIPLRQLGKRE